MFGTIYGVVLNDVEERQRLAAAFAEAPYKAPPRAPVLHIKPAAAVQPVPACIGIPDGIEEVIVAATWALEFAADACRLAPNQVPGVIGGMRLALDISLPAPDYYRPAIAQRARDGFLPLGPSRAMGEPLAIDTWIDGVAMHQWQPEMLVRDAWTLVAELSQFMTLRVGDLLMIGVAGGAPAVRRGHAVELRSAGHPSFVVEIAGEDA
jgi:5-oxopent-3-ene-1,2,5-tricarboxylate decarboxylase/2-hydroxyhepta-2,4-diene-1,7-dioate isomerase